MVPNHFKLQFSAEEIDRAVSELAVKITEWANEDQRQDIVAIPVLRGGIFFFADLARAIESSVEVAPARTRFYKEGQNREAEERVEVMIQGVPVNGRRILIVDDICDTGESLKALTAELKESGAKEIKSVALIRRIVPAAQAAPDWVGFEFNGPEWFVGYGMDDAQRWRNLPAIYTMPPGGA